MSKVAIGMSGGVDSSVAALLLKKQGHEVIGITLDLFDNINRDTTVIDAKKVCESLNIKHYVIDFKEIFKEKVIDYLANEYMNGHTPNPCVKCNIYIKFGEMLNEAKKLGAQYLATGHYADIIYLDEQKRYTIKKSASDKKDQTYVLWGLKQEQLKHVLFPLANYTKEEVRQIARDNNLLVADKKESQEICFIEDNDYIKYIKNNYNYKEKVGNFVSITKKVLGKNEGIIHYTIGQRKGLKIAFNKPMYVVKINKENDEVVLGDEADLYTNTAICKDINILPFEKIEKPLEVMVKIRYSAKPAKAVITLIDEDKIKIDFEEMQKSITPGQSAVFYMNDILVGGGIIQ